MYLPPRTCINKIHKKIMIYRTFMTLPRRFAALVNSADALTA
jgi:hypothetical protein